MTLDELERSSFSFKGRALCAIVLLQQAFSLHLGLDARRLEGPRDRGAGDETAARHQHGGLHEPGDGQDQAAAEGGGGGAERGRASAMAVGSVDVRRERPQKRGVTGRYGSVRLASVAT